MIDHELDLSVFDERYRNDETGAPAFDPAVLLKIVLYAYSRGITSSRQIEQACRENIAKTHTCICPAGKKLYSNGRSNNTNGYEALRFRGAKRDCLPCPLRSQCFRDPEKTKVRQVAIFIGRSKHSRPNYLDTMKAKIGTAEGRYQYSRRMGIVEPVFANICSALGLNQFSLRGKKKVDIQWKLYRTVHNLPKIHRYSELGSG